MAKKESVEILWLTYVPTFSIKLRSQIENQVRDYMVL
jgi:hypothetical protein